MPLYVSGYMCLVVTCWERADLLASFVVCYFPIGIVGKVWYLIVSIPDLCTLTYYSKSKRRQSRSVHISRSPRHIHRSDRHDNKKSQLKIAKVFPVFKGGDKSDPSNYRPISIIPTISKIFEKHVNKHLMAYLNKYKLLHKSQSGFRQKHSCQTALVKLVDD